MAPNGRVKVTVYLAMDLKTRQVHHLYQPYCRSEYTLDCLKQWIREYSNYRALIIIWDKASWHTAKKIKNFVRRWNRYAKRHGKVRLILCYLPTKAPWLNPIEAVIGMIVRPACAGHGRQVWTAKQDTENKQSCLYFY